MTPWLLEAGPFAKVEKRFKEEILDPAIRLQQALKSSSHQYEMRIAESLENLAPEQLHGEWRLIDANMWQELRGPRKIGRALYCLHPPIIRSRFQGAAPMVIAKGVMVVESSGKEPTPHLADTNDRNVPSEGIGASLPMPQMRSITNLTPISSPPKDDSQVNYLDSPRISNKIRSHKASSRRLYGREEREAAVTSSMESLESKSSLQRNLQSDEVENTQMREKPRKFEVHLSDQRGHHPEGRRAETFPHRLRQEPSPFGSKERASQRSRRRNSVSDNAASSVRLAPEDPKTKSGSLMSAWSSWMQRSVQERL